MNPVNELAEQKKRHEEAVKKAEANKKIIMDMVESGKLPEPRPMTRFERKQIDEKGLNLMKVGPDDKRSVAALSEDLGDWIIENMYKGFPFDNLPNNVVAWFTDYVFSISYRDDLSEKN